MDASFIEFLFILGQLEVIQDKISKLIDYIDFLFVDKGSSFELLFTFSDIDEEERYLSTQELFTRNGLVSAHYTVIIKELVRNFEKTVMHAVLSVQEKEVESRLNQSLVHGRRSTYLVFKCRPKLVLISY